MNYEKKYLKYKKKYLETKAKLIGGGSNDFVKYNCYSAPVDYITADFLVSNKRLHPRHDINGEEYFQGIQNDIISFFAPILHPISGGTYTSYVDDLNRILKKANKFPDIFKDSGYKKYDLPNIDKNNIIILKIMFFSVVIEVTKHYQTKYKYSEIGSGNAGLLDNIELELSKLVLYFKTLLFFFNSEPTNPSYATYDEQTKTKIKHRYDDIKKIIINTINNLSIPELFIFLCNRNIPVFGSDETIRNNIIRNHFLIPPDEYFCTMVLIFCSYPYHNLFKNKEGEYIEILPDTRLKLNDRGECEELNMMRDYIVDINKNNKACVQLDDGWFYDSGKTKRIPFIKEKMKDRSVAGGMTAKEVFTKLCDYRDTPGLF
jgi:hypothetical protein